MTKKIISIFVAVLMVMALIPMSALAKETSRSGEAIAVNNKTAGSSKTAVASFDFETQPSDWTFIDDDGDGYNWDWQGDYSVSPHMTAYSGEGLIFSASYDNDTGMALTPDNWAITPAIDLPDDASTLTFWVAGQDASYAAEHYAIYAGPTADISDMFVIMPEAVATGTYTQKTVDISDYAGDTLYFAIRHFNVTDMFFLNIDLFEVNADGETPPVVTDPPALTEPPAPPAEGNATVILNVPTDHWQDGSGYQMLIDADAAAYGSIIPETGALTSGGDVDASIYAQFEYKIPENADGALTTSNIVSCTSVAIEIPAGIYDWCITNPTPGDRMWIASALGNVGGRQNDYQFQAGYTYEFVVTLNEGAGNDQVDVTILDENGNPPPVPDVSEALNVEGGELVFNNDPTYPWVVVTDGTRDYAKSGNAGVASSVSTLTLDVVAEAGDTISFEFKAWGEGSSTFWDHCDFYVNDEQVLYYGAYDNDWELFTYTFEAAGEYTLTWSYTKDSSVNPTGDYFALDNVEFTGNGGTVVPPTDEPVEPGEGVLINEIRVYGFEAPVRFETAGDHLNLTVPNNAPYEIEEAYWWDETEWHRMNADDVFEVGNTYSVIVKVVPLEGNFFEQKVRFFADDSTETIDWDYTERESETVAWLAVLPLETVISDLDRALNVEGGEIHFTSTGTYPWFTVEEGDRFYAQSGNAGHASTSSTVTAVVEAAEGDIVMFDFMAWGEGSSWDVCSFSVDNTVVMSYGAYDNDWETFMYPLTAGSHTLKWIYTKDSSVNPTGDFFAVDEVYVGEPIPVEAIIATENLLVPVNRSEQIEWTVLPEKAYNQEVIFVVDDPEIATVNENGKVFGVAEGETFVTIYSAENPEIFAICEVEVVDMGYTLSNIYGIAAYDPTGETQDMWINFNNGDPSVTVPVGSAPDSYAAAYADGVIYGITTTGDFYTCDFSEDAIGPANIVATGVVTDMTVVSMTFDYSHNALYGVGIDDYDNSVLFGVNKETGHVTELTVLPFTAINIAANEDGEAFAIDFDTGWLYKIDLETYDCFYVGNTGYDVNYVQDMCYDFDTNTLFWAQYYSEGTLLAIDPESGDVIEICGLIGGAGTETLGMFVLPEVEPEINEGPFEVYGLEIVPEEAEMYIGGTMQFSVVVNPFYANPELEWETDDESIIIVDQEGLVLALAKGTAMVYVSTADGEHTAVAIVNVVNPPIAGWYFEEDPAAEGWQFVDSDNDGYTWEWSYDMYTPYEGLGIIASASYINYYGALYPDNWAIAPAVTLPNVNPRVTLYAAGQDPSYAAEHFAIYVGTTDDIYDMVQVSTEYVATGNYIRYEADLADYAGETVYIAIRHFNVTDMYYLNVDQVEVWGENRIWGDANGDGVVDSVDALLLMRYVMGIEELDETCVDPWCDVNGDGVIDFTDALIIARYVLGIVPEIPV